MKARGSGDEKKGEISLIIRAKCRAGGHQVTPYLREIQNAKSVRVGARDKHRERR
jgi:hypothetical protein